MECQTRRSKISNDHICRFCGKGFVKEKTLAVHMCESKRRYLQKDERRVQSGFYVYDRFYKLTQNSKTVKTYEDFCKSPYYNAFVKFGSFMSNVNPLYPDRYIDWIIKSGVPLDKWCREELYDKYVLDLIKTEVVESAAERTINTMCGWAEKNDSSWNHYFLYANSNRVTYDIRDGKISPWILLNSDNGLTMLKKMTDEQLQIIGPMIDVAFWTDKFKNLKNDLEFVKNMIKEAKI
jgi:hypothetical protein